MTDQKFIDWWFNWYKQETHLVAPKIARKRMQQHLDELKKRNKDYPEDIHKISAKELRIFVQVNSTVGDNSNAEYLEKWIAEHLSQLQDKEKLHWLNVGIRKGKNLFNLSDFIRGIGIGISITYLIMLWLK